MNFKWRNNLVWCNHQIIMVSSTDLEKKIQYIKRSFFFFCGVAQPHYYHCGVAIEWTSLH